MDDGGGYSYHDHRRSDSGNQPRDYHDYNYRDRREGPRNRSRSPYWSRYRENRRTNTNDRFDDHHSHDGGPPNNKWVSDDYKKRKPPYSNNLPIAQPSKIIQPPSPKANDFNMRQKSDDRLQSPKRTAGFHIKGQAQTPHAYPPQKSEDVNGNARPYEGSTNSIVNGSARIPHGHDTRNSGDVKDRIAMHVNSAHPHENFPGSTVCTSPSDMEIDAHPPGSRPKSSRSEKLKIDPPQASKRDKGQGNSSPRKTLGEIETHDMSLSLSSRQLTHRDNRFHQSAAPGSMTPQSTVADMSVDSPGPIPSRGHTPVVQTLSLPPPPPPESMYDNQKVLVKHLHHFTQATAKMTSVTVQHELANVSLEKRKKEGHRWQSHHGNFTSLVEEQEKDISRMKAETGRLNEKLKKYEGAREQAVTALAKVLLAAASGQPIAKFDHESGKIKKIEADLKDAKAELRALKITADASKHSEQRFKDMEVRQGDAEAEIATLALDVKRLKDIREEFNQAVARILALEEHAHLYGTKAAEMANELTEKSKTILSGQEKLQKTIQGLQDQASHIEPMNLALLNVKADHTALDKAFHLLRNEVVGHEDGEHNPGIIDFVDQQEKKIEKFQEAIMKFDEELANFSEKIAHQEDQITMPDTAKSSQAVKPLELTSISRYDDSIKQIMDEIAELRREQESKDDIVGQEVERLDSGLSALNEAIETNNRMVETKSKNYDDSLNSIRKNVSDVIDQTVKLSKTNLPPTPVPVPLNDGSSSALSTTGPWITQGGHHSPTNLAMQQKQDQMIADQRQVLADVQNRTLAIETALISLQSRFDNLTTEQLARNMVHQLQTMYPYPAHVLRELESIRQSQSMANTSTSQNLASVAKLSKDINIVAQMSSTNLTHVSEHLEKEYRHLASIQEQHMSSLTQLNEKVDGLSPLKESIGSLSQLKEELDGISRLKERVDNLDGPFEDMRHIFQEYTKGLDTFKAALQSSKAEYGTQLKTFQSTLSTLQGKFIELEDSSVEKISGLHMKVEALKDHFGLDEVPTQDISDKNSLETPAATIASPPGDSPSDDSSAEPPKLIRNISTSTKKRSLTKKNDKHKRVREKSSGSEHERRKSRKFAS